MDATPDVVVSHTPESRRFIIETATGMDVPQLLYDISGNSIRMNSVRVPTEYRNQGYASLLTKTALEYAEQEQLRVVPICPFVQWYLKQHPEYASLVKSDA